MGRLKQCNDDELTAPLLKRLQAHTGKRAIAPVFREMGNSSLALDSYLTMEQSVASCSLDEREVEAIKLLVSEINRCEFCLSVHTAKATAAGLDVSQQLAVRRGEMTGEVRLDALLELTSNLARAQGPMNTDQLEQARQAGLSDQNLMDLVLVVSTIFLTNTFNHINDSDLVLPAAPVAGA